LGEGRQKINSLKIIKNHMDKNKKIIGIIIVVIALIASFYTGMKYGGNNVAAAAATRGGNFQAGARGMNFRGGAGGGGANATAGDIISKDATSLTVRLRDGGSRIIFFSSSTPISAIASSSPSDLTAGKQVIIQGTANQDGSINATNIQVR
jgi:hypothetical protein